MLFGRDTERVEIGALLEAARAGRSGALVIRGEPGIGKTALLDDARERAADMHVLSARGVESESELPFAALHQLLRPALGNLDRLPSPQATALRGALGLAEGAGDERFLVFAACLTLLAEHAERRPVLCLVDDAHWLDAASADALLFAARRLEAEGVVMLFAARDGDVRTFDARDIPSLTLGGLDVDAVETLLARGAGGSAAPSVRDRLAELAGGNALALLELPTALTTGQLAGTEPLPEALPLTRQVEGVFLERVRRLPEEAQWLLLVAAADDTGSLTTVTRAAEASAVLPDAFAEVEEAGLVLVHGARLGFRHPLVRSAVYAAATSTERRAAHRALAEALAGDVEHADSRAWHLAASVPEPDEDAVRALEEAAERAQSRAGYMAAAKALARAAELSVDSEARGRRLAGAARSASTAGEDDYAVAMANQARPLVDDPVLRAEIGYAVGLAEFRRGRPLDGLPTLLEAARGVLPVDPRKAVELLIWAMPCAVSGGDPAALVEVSRVAAAVIPRADDTSAHVAYALAGISGAMAGDATARADRLEEAFVWASTADEAQYVSTIGVAAFYVGDHERSAALINRAASLARARGELGILAEALTMRAFELAMAQSFDEAAVAAGESAQFAKELGAANLAARSMSVLAFIAAIHGDEEGARRQAEGVIAHAATHGPSLGVAFAIYALAMLDLGRGRWTEALESLDTLADTNRHGSLLLAALTVPDRIEAAVRRGRPEAVRTALPSFETWAERSGAAWAQPRLASCRALLAEGAEATVHYEEALRLGGDARPFDLARIQLLYGEHLRRERRRTDARIQLRAALEAFERFRAEAWAERARAELRASGETARKRDPSTLDQLTPQELQIARLVAEGLSNKEVAAQLFLSPRTIEFHLRNAFAKLGVTSRTQLALLPLDEANMVTRRRAAPAPA